MRVKKGSRKRDRSVSFTSDELVFISNRAAAEKDELTEQLAESILALGKYLDKYISVQDLLMEKASHLTEAIKYTDKETLGGRIVAGLADKLRELVHGWQTGELDPELVSVNWNQGTPFEMHFKGHWAAELVSAGIAKMLKKEDGTYWNNVTYEMHYLGETFYVEVQRKSGKTVKQQLNEAEARIKELEQQLTGYRRVENE